MRFVYLGAEVPSNRVIMESAAVSSMGVSVWGLIKRGLPKNKKYLLSNYFRDGVDIYVYPGIPAGKEYSYDELEDFCVEYEAFIADNIDRITLFAEVNHPSLPDEFIAQQRQTVWADVPEEKFAVVYSGKDLESLATRYLNVIIPSEYIDENQTLESSLRRYSSQHGSKFHALGVAKPDLMRNSVFETASTLAWLSPMMRGETIVWDGAKLVRYPKRMKEQARPRYAAIYARAGLDLDKIQSDDAVEVSKLALWSYQQLENNGGLLVTMEDNTLPDSSQETTPAHVTNRGSNMQKLNPRNPLEIRPIPVVGMDTTRVLEPDADGREVLRDVPVLTSSASSMRACDTCFIKNNCPAYQPQSTCAYNLPLELKTKDQLKGVINTMLEIQGQRVVFGKFVEDLNGGYPDPNVGLEMDRFFKMLETVKKLDESKELMRVTVERQGAAGVLSSLFGDKAQVLNQLPNNGMDETQTNEVIRKVTGDFK